MHVQVVCQRSRLAKTHRNSTRSYEYTYDFASDYAMSNPPVTYTEQFNSEPMAVA